MVSVRGANVWLGERRALKNLRWDVEAGQHWLVTGPNGSGKSTLLRLLHGQVRPALDGEIYWQGFSQGDGIWALRKRVAWMGPALESDYRFPDTVRDCVASGFESTVGLVRKPTENQLERVGHLLEVFELETLAQRRLSTLSYGQRRRAMIARALVNRPRLLLLDEPSEGLDPASIIKLTHILKRSIDGEDCQLICASHLSWGSGLFTHELVLDGGQIKAINRFNT